MKITIAGIGFVGLANAVLLAQHNDVTVLDIDESRVDMINNRISPIHDTQISEYLSNKNLNIAATTDIHIAYADADYIIIATPTDYNAETEYFDTSSIEKVIADILSINITATIIIKSTVPVGYTNTLREKFNVDNIIFSPEFLREGQALHDNLYPSRIVIGEKSDRAMIFAGLLSRGAIKKDIPIVYTDSTEAEAIKLFSNAYLAMRVAYFNELDTYCDVNNLNSKDIIDAVGLDPRIGNHYNNPSFGYGGYCFPKDTKQLKSNFKDIPNNLINAIVDTNTTRKNFIANQIISKNPKVVGIYRLVMKSGSDNFRASAILDIIKYLQDNNIDMIIYEPTISNDEFMGVNIVNDLTKFKELSDLLVTNRIDENLTDVMDKVYTRDLYESDV